MAQLAQNKCGDSLENVGSGLVGLVVNKKGDTKEGDLIPLQNDDAIVSLAELPIPEEGFGCKLVAQIGDSQGHSVAPGGTEEGKM